MHFHSRLPPTVASSEKTKTNPKIEKSRTFFKHKWHPEDTQETSRIETKCTFTFFLIQKKKQKPSRKKKTTRTFTAFSSAKVDSEGGHPHLERGRPHRGMWFPWLSLALLGSRGPRERSWALLWSPQLYWALSGLLALLGACGLSWVSDAATGRYSHATTYR